MYTVGRRRQQLSQRKLQSVANRSRFCEAESEVCTLPQGSIRENFEKASQELKNRDYHPTHCLVLRVQALGSGDDSKEDPPVPMPNTEVKLLHVDDTWRETARESR